MVRTELGSFKIACEMKKRFRLDSIARYYNCNTGNSFLRHCAELALYNKEMIEFRRKSK